MCAYNLWLLTEAVERKKFIFYLKTPQLQHIHRRVFFIAATLFNYFNSRLLNLNQFIYRNPSTTHYWLLVKKKKDKD